MAPTEPHNTNVKLLSDQNVVTPPLEQTVFAIQKERRRPFFHSVAQPVRPPCVSTTRDLDQMPAWLQMCIITLQSKQPGHIIQGKRQCRSLNVCATRVSSSNTFSVYDRHTGQSFFIDTGVGVSVYPVSPQSHKTNPPFTTLSAANGIAHHQFFFSRCCYSPHPWC